MSIPKSTTRQGFGINSFSSVMLWRMVFLLCLMTAVAAEELKRLRFGADSYMNQRNATPTYRGDRWLPPSHDGINVIDGLRLFGILYACYQLTFIIALVIRIYIMDDIIDEDDDEDNIVKVTDPTGVGMEDEKKKKRKKRSAKAKKNMPKKAIVATLGRPGVLREDRTQDDDLEEINVEIEERTARSVTAQEPTLELAQVSAKGGSKFSAESTQDSIDMNTLKVCAKRSSIHKSSRLPRAPKGHQVGFLKDMEEFLLNDTEDDDDTGAGKKKRSAEKPNKEEKMEGSGGEKTARRNSKENKESTVTMGSKDEAQDVAKQ